MKDTTIAHMSYLEQPVATQFSGNYGMPQPWVVWAALVVGLILTLLKGQD